MKLKIIYFITEARRHQQQIIIPFLKLTFKTFLLSKSEAKHIIFYRNHILVVFYDFKIKGKFLIF